MANGRVAKVLSIPLLFLFVEELEDASSGRGQLGDEGSF